MIKNILKILVLPTILLGLLFSACEDLYTENDDLGSQRMDVSIYIYDIVTDSSLTNAEVTMTIDSVEETVSTNEFGIAYFTNVKIDINVPVMVEKNNYVKIKTMIIASADDNVQSQYTAKIGLYSLTQNMATIKGKLEIETDLTNDEPEKVPEGTKFYAYLSKSVGASIEFVANVDSNGNYEFIVPASNEGISYDLKYSSLELDQKIAINGYEDEPDFPETYPTIVTINTVFNSEESALSVPTVPSIYAYVDSLAAWDNIAVVSEVVVDNDGSVINLYWLTSGYGYTSDSVDVIVVSLFDGNGALIRVNVEEENGTVSKEYSSMNIINSGSGYPTFSYANRVGSNTRSLPSYVLSLKSGEIRIVNGNYGTGVQRSKTIK